MQLYKYHSYIVLQNSPLSTQILLTFQDDDQLYQQIDSSRENIAADPPIRPALLMQNSYRDDREERPDNGEGGKMTCAFPLYFIIVYVTLK